MKISNLFDRVHSRLGDFWWYSLLIFLAARVADVLNMYVGLWLVPKYVPPSELGAIQPLMSFASFLAIPIGVIATTFRQEVSNLAVAKEFGKLKTLMRGVFIAAGIFLVAAIVVSHFILPHFLIRIRIVEGSLGLLVITYSFINALAPLFQNAVQSLKKFKATTMIHLLGAPIRLVTMLLTMPLRALSGYVVGQTSTQAFSIITSVIALRKELSVKAEIYWTQPTLRRCARLLLIFGISGVIGGISTLVESTVLRQRIPELESAAYYMTTRFSDISNFVTMTLLFTIFPFTAELAAKGKSTLPIMLKAAAVITGTSAILAVLFWIFGHDILDFLPNASQYSQYYWAIPWAIAILTISAISSLYFSVETSANRLGFMWWSVPLTLAYTILLLTVTGNGYYIHLIPPNIGRFIHSINVTSLQAMLSWMTAFQIVRLIACVIDGYLTRTRSTNDA